jgi:hypothetical protein
MLSVGVTQGSFCRQPAADRVLPAAASPAAAAVPLDLTTVRVQRVHLLGGGGGGGGMGGGAKEPVCALSPPTPPHRMRSLPSHTSSPYALSPLPHLLTVCVLSPPSPPQSPSLLRTKHETALAVHLRHAAPAWPEEEEAEAMVVVGSGGGGGEPLLPRWVAHGSRHTLGALCGEYLEAVEAVAAALEGGGGAAAGDRVDRAAEEQQLWHSTEVWRLLEYLYGTNRPVPPLPSPGGGGDDDAMGDAEEEEAEAVAVERARAVANCADGPFWRRRVTSLLQVSFAG